MLHLLFNFRFWCFSNWLKFGGLCFCASYRVPQLYELKVFATLINCGQVFAMLPLLPLKGLEVCLYVFVWIPNKRLLDLKLENISSNWSCAMAGICATVDFSHIWSQVSSSLWSPTTWLWSPVGVRLGQYVGMQFTALKKASLSQSHILLCNQKPAIPKLNSGALLPSLPISFPGVFKL